MKLKDIHNRIDQIDDQILLLLEKRLRLSIGTIAFKKVIENSLRENNILLRLISLSKELPRETVENIFQAIFKESKKLQAKAVDARFDNS